MRASTVCSALGALFGVFLIACGGSSRTIGQPPKWRQPTQVKPDATKPGAVQTIVFAPRSAQTKGYNDPPTLPPPSTELFRALDKEMKSISKSIQIDGPVPDGRLFAAARDLAAVTPEKSTLEYRIIEFALQRHGIIEPSPHLLVLWGPDDPSALIEQLRKRLPTIMANGAFTRWGVGTAPRGSGEVATVFALQGSNVATDPMPRALPKGGAVVLRGKILNGYRDAQLFVTRPSGHVDRPSVRRSRKQFFAKVECGAHKGKNQIEVTAVNASGSTVLANFPVWCHEAAPTSITIKRKLNTRVVDAAAAEKEFVRLVNAARKKRGVPPLTIDPAVMKVARTYSEEMRRTGVVAHVSPTTGSASDRVKAAGIRTPAVLENVARAYGIGEAHRGLMNSPGHLTNIVSKLVTHIGIGVVLGENIGGRRELFVTQVFIRIPPPISAARVKRTLRAKTLKVRKNLKYDKTLDKIAQQFAKDIAAGKSTSTASKRAASYGQALAKRFKGVGTVVTTVAHVDAYDAASAFSEKGISHFGLGVAQGTHREIGEGAIFIVVMYAQPRKK